MHRSLLIVIPVAVGILLAMSLVAGASGRTASGRICKFVAAPKNDVGVDFITFGSCARFNSFAASQGGGIHPVPRTTVYGEPRCAFKTSPAAPAAWNVGTGVMVWKSRSPKSYALPCRIIGDGHYQHYTRVSILYAAAAAAAVNP